MPGLKTTSLRLLTALLLACTATALRAEETSGEMLVSVRDQQIAVIRDGMLVAKYPISTSRFGLGDARGSYKTPLGRLRVCEKYGGSLASGAVMKGRSATGEVLQVNAPGRDPIVTRILWLEGTEAQNRNARDRAIYIHGTPEENRIGKPVSWGCIRMRSKDVIALYSQVGIGAGITIQEDKLPRLAKYDPSRAVMVAHNAAPPPPPIASAPSKPAPTSSSSRATAPQMTLEAKKAAALTFSGVGFGKEPGSKTKAMDMKGSILLSGLNRQPEATAEFPARQLAEQRAAAATARTH